MHLPRLGLVPDARLGPTSATTEKGAAMTLWAERTEQERADIVTAWTREIPLDYNGYVPVAMRAVRLRADLVQVGDILILTDYVTPVAQITERKVEGNGHALHFSGDINVIRFPHEFVSVLRRNA